LSKNLVAGDGNCSQNGVTLKHPIGRVHDAGEHGSASHRWQKHRVPICDKGIDNLWLQPLKGGPGHQLTTTHAEDSLLCLVYAWPSDGNSLAFVRGDSR